MYTDEGLAYFDRPGREMRAELRTVKKVRVN